MRSDVRDAIIFVSGLVIGGISTWFAARAYYKKKADEEIKSIENAFVKRLNEIEDERDNALNVASDAILSANDYGDKNPGESEFLKNRSTLEGFVRTVGTERTDYTKYYNKNSKETIEVDEAPPEDEPEDSGGVEMYKTDKIYEIGYGDYQMLPSYETKELYLYQSDNVLIEACDGAEEIIDNREYLIGDVIEKSGFLKRDDRTMWIRNELISCEFEVTKVPGKYGV